MKSYTTTTTRPAFASFMMNFFLTVITLTVCATVIAYCVEIDSVYQMTVDIYSSVGSFISGIISEMSTVSTGVRQSDYVNLNIVTIALGLIATLAFGVSKMYE